MMCSAHSLHCYLWEVQCRWFLSLFSMSSVYVPSGFSSATLGNRRTDCRWEIDTMHVKTNQIFITTSACKITLGMSSTDYKLNQLILYKLSTYPKTRKRKQQTKIKEEKLNRSPCDWLILLKSLSILLIFSYTLLYIVGCWWCAEHMITLFNYEVLGNNASVQMTNLDQRTRCELQILANEKITNAHWTGTAGACWVSWNVPDILLGF